LDFVGDDALEGRSQLPGHAFRVEPEAERAPSRRRTRISGRPAQIVGQVADAGERASHCCRRWRRPSVRPDRRLQADLDAAALRTEARFGVARLSTSGGAHLLCQA
jgi:hypothetical protein